MDVAEVKTGESDAHLIASSPDLLAACEAMLSAEDRRAEPGMSQDPDALADLYRGMEAARAALARAKGGA